MKILSLNREGAVDALMRLAGKEGGGTLVISSLQVFKRIDSSGIMYERRHFHQSESRFV
jgi:hypothetical protein